VDSASVLDTGNAKEYSIFIEIKGFFQCAHNLLLYAQTAHSRQGDEGDYWENLTLLEVSSSGYYAWSERSPLRLGVGGCGIDGTDSRPSRTISGDLWKLPNPR
jgi:hypothetical protein